VRIELNAREIRVIGCLMEKSVITPEQYPLSLNALTAACNQKSSREPVMQLSQGEVQHTLRVLEEKRLVAQESFRTRVEKYVQRFCNTPFADYQLDPAEFAVITLLLLRGPQTPGELRSRSGRLHEFPDNEAVRQTLEGLIDRDGGPLVIQLPRTPGRQDSEYMHLFAGDVDVEALAAEAREAPAPRPSAPRPSAVALEQRVAALEAEVAELKATVTRLTS